MGTFVLYAVTLWASQALTRRLHVEAAKAQVAIIGPATVGGIMPGRRLGKFNPTATVWIASTRNG